MAEDMRVERTVVLRNPSGLHARPAALFAEAAAATGLEVTLTRGERTVNGASVLSVLTLGCHAGDEVTVAVTDPTGSADGAQAAADALAGLVALIESGLGEPVEPGTDG